MAKLGLDPMKSKAARLSVLAWVRRVLAISLGLGLLVGIALSIVGLASGSREVPEASHARDSGQVESSSHGPKSEIELVGVDIAFLAEKGMILSAVPPERPATVTRKQAEAIATKLPSVSARDAILAHVKDTVHDRDAWVISLDGSLPGDRLSGIGEVKVFVALVDAATGENFLTWLIRQPPPDGWPDMPSAVR